MIEADHHCGCCLEKPAYMRRRRTQPQPIEGRRIIISDGEDSPTTPHQYEPPVRSQGNGATVGDEPMVTWAKYGLTAPLALWPPTRSQAREDSFASAQQHFDQT